jgi:hypothetical protein
MEPKAMTNMMINFELVEVRQAELAAQMESHIGQTTKPSFRINLIRIIWKRMAPRRSRPVKHAVDRAVRV